MENFAFKFSEDDDIVAVLAEHFSLTKDLIESPTRKKEIVRARDFIAYLLREYADMSYPVIGRLLGGRDHTTIIHAHRKIQKLIEQKPHAKAELAELIEKVKSIKEKKKHIEKTLIPGILAEAEMEKLGEEIAPVYKEIPERSLKILELFREGLTLRNISNMYGVTHERIRQIVIRTVRQSAINESVQRGISLDPEIVLEEEFKKRKAVRTKLKPQKEPNPQKEKRWSTYYAACKSCGLTTYPHVKKGLCEKCVGSYRADRREGIVMEHGNKCDSCGISRDQAISLYGRDLYITKDQKVYCQKCFRTVTGTILGHSSKGRRRLRAQ